VTFRQEAERFVAAHAAGWRNEREADQWLASLRDHVYPVFGDRPIADIETADVLAALTPVWSTKAVTAGRVRLRIERVLDAAKARGLRSGDNPAAWKNHLDHLLPKVRRIAPVVHHSALPYAEVAALMADLKQRDDVEAAALQFTILCASRTGETLGATWDEIDLAGRIWTVLGRRMKTGNEHRVPLSNSAITVLEGMASIRMSDFVFPGTRQSKPLGHAAMWRALRAMRPGVAVHGFRSCFRDWAAEQTGFPSEVAEMALGHVVGGAVERAYRRGDMMEKRRALMAQWRHTAIGRAPDAATWSRSRARRGKIGVGADHRFCRYPVALRSLCVVGRLVTRGSSWPSPRIATS
jgi:integrase